MTTTLRPQASQSGPFRVLVVDDSAPVAAGIRAVLLDDAEVVTSTEPLQALKLLEDQRFHVVCSDFRMPGLNGTQLLERVAALPYWVGCVLITGDAEYLRRSKNSSHYVLLKPFNPERLLRIVTQLARVAEMKWAVTEASDTMLKLDSSRAGRA